MRYPILLLLLSTPMTFADADPISCDEKTAPVLRVVLFTPSDVDPPDGVRERLKEYVDYSQVFFSTWMKHWNYDCESPLPVERDGDGYPVILYVKGQHTEASGRYQKVTFQGEVVRTACRQYKLNRAGEVWWIFTYKGPERRGFRGEGNSKRGGTATSIYDPSREGHLLPGIELASEDAGRLQAKASIHELGHALGLPHIGPRENDKLGNSLMGATTPRYRDRYADDARVYLSEASAAMLWKHPLMSGTTKDRNITPTLEFHDLKSAGEQADGQMCVSGRIVSDYTPHSVVVGCESESTREGYWRKCFVGRVREDRTFEVLIDELPIKDGHLRVVCCFTNGAVIGNRQGRGLKSGFVRQYTFTDGRFILADGWKP